ncbi:MAG TPA: PPOX class F420-dependent oxidoreductase [Solirubrobacteraceae bacterium]|nr:PPOX class F420-dependent oxidoreductase [Solirubrobacteraceae bacterium]
MPKPPLPPELDEFLAHPHPAVIATLEPDGTPHTAATWYVWDDGRVLVNMAATRKRLEHLHNDPRVSITVIAADDWYRHVTLRGRIVTLEDDEDLSGIDRLSRRYMGDRYSARDQRRVNGWIEVEHWHAWVHGEAWRPEAA